MRSIIFVPGSRFNSLSYLKKIFPFSARAIVHLLSSRRTFRKMKFPKLKTEGDVIKKKATFTRFKLFIFIIVKTWNLQGKKITKILLIVLQSLKAFYRRLKDLISIKYINSILTRQKHIQNSNEWFPCIWRGLQIKFIFK